MINKLKKIFSNKTTHPISLEHQETSHLFALKYQDLEMGSLKFINNKWIFEYSELFKKQNEITPLIDFPDLDKSYKSEILWPFFSNRIPSLKQPRVQEYIAKHPTESKNTVKLLELFGEYSVNNPFKLQLK
ncbi:hypothetical protein EZ449_09525 [Pedobacter frigidisoli]|uniref:HipA N-terminal subdomain 1 domain-containing protein n=1 Tax=Pedobacter frigidisoli TaxID=2530455 RepID=A0A4R0P1D9_9SPHI|nr:HipA N-terminal domain-containing protein [Pedobacter frigidisoli]TCD10574.1 hypothetical protein EZ449_09525 [Pedobacter frigidisoli]